MSKLIKRLVAISMSLFLAFSNSMICLAEDNATREVIVEKGDYVFHLTEIDKGDEGIIRMYSNDNARSIKGLDETKCLLYALGYNEKYVEGLTSNEVQEYALASEIIVSSAYMKTDEKGNATYIDAETALEEVEVARDREQTQINNLINGIATVETDTKENAYMQVIHSATISGEICKMQVSAEWLTMPIIRSYDSIGACGQYLNCLTGTEECKVSYTKMELQGGTYHKEIVNTTVDDIEPANNDGWAGAAAVFKLPTDVTSSDYSILYSNYSVSFSYKGKVTEPDHRLNFNTMGSYMHSTIGVVFEPSVSIDTSGGNAGIGISVVGMKDTLSVWLALSYVP